jgi:peptidoglycan/LPS O-acetylase OafA/YrhL
MAQPSGSKAALIEGVHALRALAAISVVIFHAGGTIGLDKYQGLKNITSMTNGLDSGVDLFFVISGFVISLPFFLGRKVKIPMYIENRFLRIYPISALTACIFLGSGWLIYGRQPDLDTALSSILLLPNGTDPVPIVLWTLKQELLFYALFAVVFYRSNIGLPLLAAWGFLSLLVQHETAFMKWFFNAHNAQFLVGVIAAYLYVKHPISERSARQLGALSIGTFLFASYIVKLAELEEGMASILLGLLGASTVFGAACAKLSIPQSMMFLGTSSYSIYLIHFFFISLGNKTIIALLPNLPGIIALCILSASSIIFGCLYYMVFEKHLEAFRHSYLKWKSSKALNNEVLPKQ